MQRSSSPRRKRARAEYSPEPRSSGAAQGAAPSSRPIRAGAKKKPRSAVKLRWTPEEDEVLTSVVEKYGTGNWTFIGQFMAGRTGKQCREVRPACHAVLTIDT